MSDTVTVHLIANAHLDPVWLWHWQRGADEALATCRSACDILDRYLDATFTRGEAWVYEQVRTLDPALFARVRAHVQSGRWEVVNGWWVQADTNLPTAEALQATARVGQAWFREHLGVTQAPVAYLVDSFGHGAYLPRILHEAGHRHFVFMRPGQHEHALPSTLFRWRSPDGAEVLTFRITGGYLCNGPDHEWMSNHIRNAVAAPRPAGVRDVMCFYGVGNHGGGPSRRLVEWIAAHRDFAPGVRLEFSTTARYFAAVEATAAEIPVVTGELQMHAVGCYSVCGGLKRDLRMAELAAADAGRLLDACAPQADRAELDAAWREICFNQFHDILPGSSIPEAIAIARQQAGAAQTGIERLTHRVLRQHHGLRRATPAGHRLLVVNRSAVAWRGLADAEVWLDWQPWAHHLEDADGRVVPLQLAQSASLPRERGLSPIPRLLFPVELPPGGSCALRIVPGLTEAPPLPGATIAWDGTELSNGHVAVRFGLAGVAQIRDLQRGCDLLSRPLTLAALADGSDTWSHDIDRYAGYTGAPHASARFDPPVVVEGGPLRLTLRLDGQIGRSSCRLFVALVHGDPFVHCRLESNYQEPMTVLKASIGLPARIGARRDRVGGGWIDRGSDGREYPLHHALRVTAGATAYGVVLPDSFAVDVGERAIRPTLLRNSLHAYHSSSRIPMDDTPELLPRFGTDEGPVSLRWALTAAAALDETLLEQAVAGYLQPPWSWDDYCHTSRVERFE